MNVTVHCPACGGKASVPEEYLGRLIRCSRCKETFRPQSASPRASSAKETATPSVKGTKNDPRDFQPAPATASPDLVKAGHPAQQIDVCERIGRFQIREKVGRGAFGTVYRAYDPQLEREIALKVPRTDTLDSPKAVERFLREAKAAAQLRHPSIVPIYDAGRDGEQYYIASAFVHGRTLAQAMDDGSFRFRETAQIVRDLAEALNNAHELGIVHRDVKPANVMLDEKGRPHLMDFGLAHRHDSTSKLTKAGDVLGTPSYMSPEQAAGQKDDPQPASDQYSLAVMLYEMLCGQTPFSGPPGIVVYNQIHQEPAPPGQVKPGIPLDLETICLKAMSKRPVERYATLQDLADDLRRWLEDEPIRARRLGRTERLFRWCRRKPVVAGLIGAVLAALVLGTAVSSYFAIQADRRAKVGEANAQRAEQEQERADAKAAEAQASTLKAGQEKSRADKKAIEAEANARRVNARVQRERGDAHFKKEDYDRAVAEYTEAIRLDPSFAGAYKSRGEAYLRKKEYDRAIADLTEAIRLDPNFARDYRLRGEAYLWKKEKEYDRAIADFTEAVRLDPKDSLAYDFRGEAYHWKQEYDRAITNYTEAIRLDPSEASFYHDRGDSYSEKNEYDRAIADFSEAIRLDPNMAAAYLSRSEAHAMKGDKLQSKKDREKALELDPSLR